MKFGFCVMANIDEIGFFSHAEALGYDSVWAADSQQLFSDVYAVLALAARQTSRIRLGPGTAITGTRIPAVQVAAMGTLNRLAPGRVFQASAKPTAAALVAEYGEQVVLKPNRQGSSVGLQIVSTKVGLEIALGGIRQGEWIAEERILGREFTVGILRGRAMGVVEVVPKSGVFDYTSKYTKGLTEYFAPAQISDEIATKLRTAAETAFAACGCRDYARIDFMLSGDGELYLLEINTLPGMKETSLLPMSARCVGLDFVALCREMVAPAVERFAQASASRK